MSSFQETDILLHTVQCCLLFADLRVGGALFPYFLQHLKGALFLVKSPGVVPPSLSTLLPPSLPPAPSALFLTQLSLYSLVTCAFSEKTTTSVSLGLSPPRRPEWHIRGQYLCFSPLTFNSPFVEAHQRFSHRPFRVYFLRMESAAFLLLLASAGTLLQGKSRS